MPKKKKPARRPAARSPRVPRKEPYSRERVNLVLGRLKEQSGRLVGLASAIDEAKLDGVVIDGHAMLVRGLNQIDNFIDTATRAVREARSAKKGL
jgi:hypothetical protein